MQSNSSTIVAQSLIHSFSTTTRKISKLRRNLSFFRLKMLQNSRKCTFSAFFSGKLLQVSKRVRTFASQLGHGVMVTLQVLVLSFWVRIPVTQQNALIGCVLDADHRRIFLFQPSATRKARGVYDCASSFCPLFPSSSSHLWLL